MYVWFCFVSVIQYCCNSNNNSDQLKLLSMNFQVFGSGGSVCKKFNIYPNTFIFLRYQGLFRFPTFDINTVCKKKEKSQLLCSFEK